MTPAAYARGLIYNHNDRFLVNVKCGRCSHVHVVHMLDLARRGGIVCQSPYCSCTTAFEHNALIYRLLLCKQVMVHNIDERTLVFGLYMRGKLEHRIDVIRKYRKAANRSGFRSFYEIEGVTQEEA